MSLEEVQVELAKIWSRIEALENKVFEKTSLIVKHETSGVRERAPIPEFDPKILTEHQWKGRNTGVRQWAPGSLAWGWDFTDQFPDEVIAVLQKGSLTIDGSVFTLGEKVVNVKKEG